MYSLNTAQSVLENWSEYVDSKMICNQLRSVVPQAAWNSFSAVLTLVLKQTGEANSNEKKNRASRKRSQVLGLLLNITEGSPAELCSFKGFKLII